MNPVSSPRRSRARSDKPLFCQVPRQRARRVWRPHDRPMDRTQGARALRELEHDTAARQLEARRRLHARLTEIVQLAELALEESWDGRYTETEEIALEGIARKAGDIARRLQFRLRAAKAAETRRQVPLFPRRCL